MIYLETLQEENIAIKSVPIHLTVSPVIHVCRLGNVNLRHLTSSLLLHFTSTSYLFMLPGGGGGAALQG